MLVVLRPEAEHELLEAQTWHYLPSLRACGVSSNIPTFSATMLDHSD